MTKRKPSPYKPRDRAPDGRHRLTPWLCDGHGHWYHDEHGIVLASEARALGAPVPDDEADPMDDDGGAPCSEMPF